MVSKLPQLQGVGDFVLLYAANHYRKSHFTKPLNHPRTMPLIWYVIRILGYQRNQSVRDLFEHMGISYFQPTRVVLRGTEGKKKPVEVPYISNMIFCHTTADVLQPLTDSHEHGISFYYIRGGRYSDGRYSRCMTVNDKEMDNFIRCCKEKIAKPEYMSPDDPKLRSGQQIRIIGGPLDGVEGIYLRHNKRHQIAILLPGLTAVKVNVNPNYVQVIDPKPITKQTFPKPSRNRRD